MDLDVLKNFIKHDVEMLVAGVWIEGHLMPIVKSVITLLPIGPAKEFYGPTAIKAEVVQAVRQVRKQPTDNTAPAVNQNPNLPPPVQSGFGNTPSQGHPGNRFVHK